MVVLLLDANVPLSVPTVTVDPAETLVGKSVGSACSVSVGSLDNTNEPAPVSSVVSWPTKVSSIDTSSVVLAAAPVTLTENFVTPLSLLTV